MKFSGQGWGFWEVQRQCVLLRQISADQTLSWVDYRLTQNARRTWLGSSCRREGLAGLHLLPDLRLEISFNFFFFKRTETFLLILRFFHVRNFSLSKISSFISLYLLVKIWESFSVGLGSYSLYWFFSWLWILLPCAALFLHAVPFQISLPADAVSAAGSRVADGLLFCQSFCLS